MRWRAATRPTRRSRTFGPWNDAFFRRDARGPWQAPANDLDVITIFAEALDEPHAVVVVGTCRRASRPKAPRRWRRRRCWNTPSPPVPGAWGPSRPCCTCHLHLMEMSPTPEAALKHGDRRDRAGCTRQRPPASTWRPISTCSAATTSNVVGAQPRPKAARIDRKYEALHGAKNFYTVYRIHNVHFEAYGAMFLGQAGRWRWRRTDRLIEMLPEDVVRFLPELFESFWGQESACDDPSSALWQDILDIGPARRSPSLQVHHLRHASGPPRWRLANLGRHGEAAGERGQGRGGARHASRRLDGVQQHGGGCAGGRRGDDGRRTGLQGRPHRRRGWTICARSVVIGRRSALTTSHGAGCSPPATRSARS